MRTQPLYQRNFLLHLQDRAGYDLPILVKKPAEETPNKLFIQQLQNEYRLTKQLEDVLGVRKAYALDGKEEQPELVLQYLKGQTLAELIRNDKLALREKLRIAVQVVIILRQVHEHKVMHKDLCSSNILITDKDLADSQNGVFIIDFGAASVMMQERVSRSTFSNTLTDDLTYLSPEQTGRMNRIIDYRTDFYSFGVLLYELIVGNPPFESDDPLEIIHSHIAKKPTPPHILNPDISEQLSAIVMNLLEKNADERYQSAIGIQADLEECLQQLKQKGFIEQFVLGRSDLMGIFRVPQKLYGREYELNSLLESFERVSNGEAELFMVSGYSGVGKSALVHEVQKPISAKRGFFIEGKFDQYQRNIPYFAWQQAFSALVNQLLMESDERLSELKIRIVEAVGQNGKVLTEVIQNLELIIGPQPEVPVMGGAESLNRFNAVLQKFVKVVASEEHPLVIFLDDLHWIDSASLQLLKVLVVDPELGYVQFIGAYRDNEVDAAHPLVIFLESVKEAPVQLHQITLQNLEKSDINGLVADTLQSSIDATNPLSKLIYSKTAGNAFFTHQVLHTLNDETMLTFDAPEKSWYWNMHDIDALDITENVVEFLSANLRKQPGATQDILKLAACIGNRFDSDTLSVVAHKEINDIQRNLQPALEDGSVFRSNGDYKFVHDRIQQAAYSLIKEETKKETHWEIGQILLEQIPVADREERIFDIVNHLNIGTEFISEPMERAQLAQLNLVAGRRAKKSTAYESALRYFEYGIEHLGADAWQREYELILDLCNDAAEVAYLLSEDRRMEELSLDVFENARNISDKMKVIDIAISNELKFGRFPQAIEMGLKYLSELGLSLNPSPSDEEAHSVLAESLELMKERTVDQLLNLPELDDTRLAHQIHIIRSLTDSLAFLNWNLLITSCSTAIQLLVRHGNTSEAPLVYAFYAYILTNINTRQYEVGHVAARVAVDLLEKQSQYAMLCPVLHITNTYLFHNFNPIKDIFQKLFDTYHMGMEHGNLVYATYCAGDGIVTFVSSGVRLRDVLDKLEWYMPFTKKNQLIPPFFYCLPVVVYAKYLSNPKMSHFDEEKFIQLKKEESGGMGELITHVHRLLDLQFLQSLAVHFGQYDEAVSYGEEGHECAVKMSGSFATLRVYFLDTIACLRASQTADPERKKMVSERIERNLDFVAKWAELAPTNYGHMLHLLMAEQARISDQSEKAAVLYEQAINAAGENGFLQDCALSYDLAAEYYKQYGFEEIYKTYKLRAHEVCREWGAYALVKHLENEDPQLFVAEKSLPQITPQAVQLDIDTVIKASQAISGEMSLDKLLAKMMHLVIENAGAQVGFLIMAQGDKWVIEAATNVDKSEIQVLQSIDIDGNGAISSGIINFVSRTQETVVLQDAVNEGDFTGDQTIQQRNSKSVLCTPLINQGKISGILYLENNLTTGAFTTERVELLRVLSSEMAMALDNAIIYASLQQSEEKFRGVFESMIDVFVRATLDGTCLLVSPSVLPILGYSQEEILGQNVLNFYVDPTDREKMLEKLIESKTPGNYEFQAIRKDGRHITISLNAKVVFDDDSNPVAVEANFRDITKAKKAEEDLKSSEKRFRATFEQAAVGIAHVSPEGRFLRINEKFCEIVGYTHHQMLVRTFQDITHPDDLEADEEHVDRLLRGESDTYSTEKRYVTQRGVIVWANLTVSLIRDETGKPNYFVSVIEDITDRKNAELKVIEYQDRLKDLTKDLTIAEEKVRRQIAMDLHDNVGQMLASAHMQLSQVSQTDDPDKLSNNVEFISTTLSDAIQATREAIINLSPPQLNELGLSAAVHDYMKEQIEAKHNIITKFSGEEMDGVFDENTRLLLFRSIRELMINVVKHAQATHLDVDFIENNGNLEITVSDDGVGFLYNPDLLRLKSNRYGLFSIQERIADLGGTMVVKSEFDIGTTIILTVPVV